MTPTPPTQAGWYWATNGEEGEVPVPVWVYRDSSGALAINDVCHALLYPWEHNTLWSASIPEPVMPAAKEGNEK